MYFIYIWNEFVQFEMYLFSLKCICPVWNVFVQFEMYLSSLECICPVWNVFELVRQQVVGLGWQDPPRDCEQTIYQHLILIPSLSFNSNFIFII